MIFISHVRVSDRQMTDKSRVAAPVFAWKLPSLHMDASIVRVADCKHAHHQHCFLVDSRFQSSILLFVDSRFQLMRFFVWHSLQCFEGTKSVGITRVSALLRSVSTDIDTAPQKQREGPTVFLGQGGKVHWLPPNQFLRRRSQNVLYQ